MNERPGIIAGRIAAAHADEITAMRAELDAARARVAELEAESERLRAAVTTARAAESWEIAFSILDHALDAKADR